MWASYEATRRGAFVLPAGEARAICSEPFPDVAVEQAAKAALQMQYGGAKGSLTPEVASKIVELAGRTQTVLILRTILYSACEQSASGKLTGTDIREIYQDALATVRAMTDADKATEVRRAAESLDRLDPSTRKLIEELRGESP